MGLTQMPDYKIVDNTIGGKGIFYPSDSRVIDPVRDIRTILDLTIDVYNNLYPPLSAHFCLESPPLFVLYKGDLPREFCSSNFVA